MDKIRVALIGKKFMERTHTHAYTDLPIFFDTGVEIEKKVICASDDRVGEIAKRWG